MRNTLLTLVTLVALSVIFSCDNPSKTETPHAGPLQKASWILGEWQNGSNHGIYTETWTQENDSTYTAESYYIIENDTPSNESIRLEQHGNGLLYIPTAAGQNNNQPVTFRQTSATDKQLVFENPNHDFPSTIVYTLVNDDSLVAYIAGKKAEKPDTLFFPMNRVN